MDKGRKGCMSNKDFLHGGPWGEGGRLHQVAVGHT
jgi:hypothetical protein